MPPPYVSIVVCVYNEAGNILPLIEQVRQSLQDQDFDYELIYVNDGSDDQTLTELRMASEERLIVLDLQKNYGQSLALAAGIDAARGHYIVTLDGDLQNDPADIPRLLKLAETGDYDLVAGIRANRQDGALLRRFPSRLANALLRWTTGVRMKDYGCALKVFRADLAKRLGLYGELHRFIPVLATLEGARITQVDVRHHPRRVGQSKYGLGRTGKVISDLFLLLFLKKYLRKPMHLFGSWGALALVAGFGLLVYLFGQSLVGGPAVWSGGLPLLSTLLLLGGFQFIAFGLMLELQMRTYYESQDKKPYQVRRVYRSAASGTHAFEFLNGSGASMAR